MFVDKEVEEKVKLKQTLPTKINTPMTPSWQAESENMPLFFFL